MNTRWLKAIFVTGLLGLLVVCGVAAAYWAQESDQQHRNKAQDKFDEAVIEYMSEQEALNTKFKAKLGVN